mmetsp:Transcript_30424/g.66868  ORF Transcript_30424/g.66868 Transcript_30424/m.66868 type:complete len:449 (-) Transcript_30424:46-1392(-)
MISYSPRRCLSSSDNDQQPIMRVPSDDDPNAFHFVPRVAAANMLRRASSARTPSSSYGGGLPVFSSSTPRKAGRSRSFTSSYSLNSPYGGRRSSSSSLFASFSSPRCAYPYDDDEDDKYTKSTASSKTKALAITSIITVLFYAYATYRASSIATQLSILSLDLRTMLFDHNNDVMALSEANALEKELQGEIDYRNKEIARNTLAKTMSTNQNEMLLKKEEALRKRIDRMENDIAEISRMEAIERFGEGPHRIEFSLQFMNDDGAFVPEMAKSRTNKFVMELAPLSLMPHSVLHFLEMIDHQLWNGAAFVHHVDHVVQAVPTAFRTAETMKPMFDNLGLSELAFQEYHEEYPHDTYSVGFSGRPGGLEFYINTQDNSLIHGPGGQTQHALREEGDPCFAKIVSGHHVIDRMNQKGQNNKKEIHIIGIERAVLLPQGMTSHQNPYSRMKR